MQGSTTSFWPTARHYAEAVQCPAVCFDELALKRMLPAVDRLGMPLVTSGQFAYVFKLNPEGASDDALAVRCFRGFLGDREDRYRALDAHLDAHRIAALPRFKYLPRGILVMGGRYPALVMEWVEGPTLDVYLDEAVGRREALLHLADEWLKLVGALSEAEVAHGDLQHGNIIVERGQLRLVDLDGMFVPALEGFRASEVGHQHYQHPARDITHFSRDTDNFSALVVYLSLISLAGRPELWREHHDENLLFTRADFADPDASALFPKIEAIGEEHARLARALKDAARSPDPSATPRLVDLVGEGSKLPTWINAPSDIDVSSRTREVSRASALRDAVTPWPPRHPWRSSPATPNSASVQSLFNAAGSAGVPAQVAPRDPSDIRGNTFFYARTLFGNSYGYIWWIPLHNFILGEVWGAFGVGGPLAGMMLSFLLLFTLFLFYGFFRAVYEAETTTGGATAAAAANLAGQGRPSLGAAAPQPFFSTTPAPRQTPAPLPSAQQQPSAAPARAVVGNSSLAIYHLPDCAWADKILRRNRVEFDSPSAAHSAGFRPCRVCKP
jgi:Metal binding domain of Ada